MVLDASLLNTLHYKGMVKSIYIYIDTRNSYRNLNDTKIRHNNLSILGRLVSFFLNGISTFADYLIPKPFSLKNSSGTI